MVAILAFFLSLGIVSSPDQVTPELTDQYQTQIIGSEMDTM